jgi:hypothetical protein
MHSCASKHIKDKQRREGRTGEQLKEETEEEEGIWSGARKWKGRTEEDKDEGDECKREEGRENEGGEKGRRRKRRIKIRRG